MGMFFHGHVTQYLIWLIKTNNGIIVSEGKLQDELGLLKKI